MSDAEPDEDESIENPDPEADAIAEAVADLNVEADNAHLEQPARQNIEPVSVDNILENAHVNSGGGSDDQNINAASRSDNHVENSHEENEINFDLNPCSEDPESFQQEIGENTEADSHCHLRADGENLAAEDERGENTGPIHNVEELNCDDNLQGYNDLAAEDEQYIPELGSSNAECGNRSVGNEELLVSGLHQDQNDDVLEAAPSDSQCQVDPEGLDLRQDEFLGPESELEEVQPYNEPTESDQEANADLVENPVNVQSQNEVIEKPVMDVANGIAANVNNVSERLVPEDEICVLSTVKTESGTESYQPECDQSNRNVSVNESSQNDGSSCHESNENHMDSQEVNFSENEIAEKLDNNRDTKESITAHGVSQADCDKNDAFSDDSSNKPKDKNPNESGPSNVASSSVVTKDSGAIPKVPKQSNPGSGTAFQREQCSQSKSSPKKHVELDSEDELLNELDETLKSSFIETSSCDHKSSTETCAISNVEQTANEHEILSCDQCLRNNLKCSFKVKHSDRAGNENASGSKEMKKQLHQAKQLLLDRECEISRLKEDLSDHRVRCETLTSERDANSRELERLKNHNSDDLYIPQIKELEYTIAQQTNEIRSLKDKLSSHDGAAKRAIATLQSEMKLRVDQVMKQCEEARNEKDTMVVKYAQAEHKNLEFQKRAERAENKLKEMEKERDVFLGKMRAVKDQRSKIAADLEAKNAESCNLHRELDKHRELVSSADTRVKWAQNKLKAELEAHKETKLQLDKMNVKLKEAKEETQQIRQDCQAIIKTYQESEEVKSNSLDKELKQKESELLEREVQKTNFELAHVKTQRELEQVKTDLRESQSKFSTLSEKLSSVEVEKEQATVTNAKYGDIIQNQKKDIQDLQKRVESLVQYKTDFTSAQELIKNLDAEIAELKMTNKELVSDMDSCRRRESDKLELTSKLSRKNAELQSENSTLSNKVLTLTGELQAVKMEVQDSETKLKDLNDRLTCEQKQRHDEVQSLNTKLAGKCKAVEDLSRKLEDEKDEIKTLKRKHTNNVKDLTRQLQQVRRKLENYEASTNGEKDTTSMGSRTSSNGSLNTVAIADQIVTHVVQPNHNTVQNSLHRNPSPEQEYPVITEQVEVDKQTLIERIVKLQRALARKNEKIEFMEDHISQLVDEIQKKNKIIQSYILKEEAGTMTTEYRDQAKQSLGSFAQAEISRKHSIMGSVYSSHSNDGTMTLDLSLEINRKVQAVLEDTLLKNMMLKENLDTLGKEIARLSQENRQLQLQLQGGKSRPRANQSLR